MDGAKTSVEESPVAVQMNSSAAQCSTSLLFVRRHILVCKTDVYNRLVFSQQHANEA